MNANTEFNPQKMAEMVFNLSKDYTATAMQAMKASTEQYEKTMDTLMKQGLVAQEEGQKLWSDWMAQAKQSQQQYWNMMDENLKKMNGLFNANNQKRNGK